MSLLKLVVEWTRRFEELSGVTKALDEFISADSAIDVSAAASKLTAELAVGGLVAVHVRTVLPAVRLGLAVAGKIWKWEALTWAAGATSGVGAGALIDAINDLHLGARLYDWTHPDPLVNTHFRASQLSASPLILDLDGDGIEITQHTGAITFDHDANGIETGTAWAGADDGLLVLDRDGNGSIDSGRELFGNNTLLANDQKAADGYAALRELDTNADGVLDASDAAFASLRVWRDLDQDLRSSSLSTVETSNY